MFTNSATSNIRMAGLAANTPPLLFSLAGYRGVVVVTSTVDVLARVFGATAGKSTPVYDIDSGTDSARYRLAFAACHRALPDAVRGWVIGEHGDSAVICAYQWTSSAPSSPPVLGVSTPGSAAPAAAGPTRSSLRSARQEQGSGGSAVRRAGGGTRGARQRPARGRGRPCVAEALLLAGEVALRLLQALLGALQEHSGRHVCQPHIFRRTPEQAYAACDLADQLTLLPHRSLPLNHDINASAELLAKIVDDLLARLRPCGAGATTRRSRVQPLPLAAVIS
ncbi:hypothetical protein [Streptomyces sp. NBC_01724]|uniref:hypothetical protein n=1 Tax=Streptomyces sp. NBC_01724 TaxID=2975922 RepID=UPI003FCDA225